ncbi:MAG: hypothetical protein WA005_18050 [Candidatus Binataceae bacterium]
MVRKSHHAATPKTVYILGAGFARDAGFPLQAEILPAISTIEFPLMVDAPVYYTDFETAREAVKEFLDHIFPGPSVPALEDVFTLLDQTIARRQSCKGYSWDHLDRLRSDLQRAILFLFHRATETYSSRSDDTAEFYRRLAAYWLRRRISAGKRADPFAIIVINWDCMLEDTIYWCLRRTGGLRKADVDYCCYTKPLHSADPHTPSLLQKASGIYNLKVVKLHGSTNWLICANCEGLFTALGGEHSVWEEYAMPRACPICMPKDKKWSASTEEILGSFFVSPTFVKVFDNPHINTAWHNAYMELAEAAKVVFVGYSLPTADYHIRTLLRRAVRSDAEIVVVLARGDRPGRTVHPRLRPYFAVTRYQEFFASRARFELDGARSYFEPLLSRNLPRILREIREDLH